MARPCVVVGDVMMDVTAMIETEIAYASDTPARVSLQPGGSAANTAAWMAWSGTPVTFVGSIGADAFGDRVRAELDTLGVDHRLHVSASLPTGTCVVIVDVRHERTMLPDSGANSDLPVTSVTQGAIPAGGHLHLSGYTLLNPGCRATGLAAIAEARRVGATCSLDPSSSGPLRGALDLFTDLLPDIDVLIANAQEAAVLSGADDPFAALDLLSRIVPVVVVKRGSYGVVARSAAGSVDAPALACEVLDTTGAGDAFAAGFLPAWTAGRDLGSAVASGQALAARAVGRVGASPMVR